MYVQSARGTRARILGCDVSARLDEAGPAVAPRPPPATPPSPACIPIRFPPLPPFLLPDMASRSTTGGDGGSGGGSSAAGSGGGGGAVAPFVFPPFHAFPPAYTVQPAAATRARQVELWVACILDYCRHYRLFWLGVEGHGGLFRNDAVEYVFLPSSFVLCGWSLRGARGRKGGGVGGGKVGGRVWGWEGGDGGVGRGDVRISAASAQVAWEGRAGRGVAATSLESGRTPLSSTVHLPSARQFSTGGKNGGGAAASAAATPPPTLGARPWVPGRGHLPSSPPLPPPGSPDNPLTRGTLTPLCPLGPSALYAGGRDAAV